MLCSVHPHGCGEHGVPNTQGLFFAGSSPRVWGTQERVSINRIVNAVHPHGCGEHYIPLVESELYSGSSPRVWGTHSLGKCNKSALRFIPTGVGNTIDTDIQWICIPVHPHGCGEHDSDVYSPSLVSGSSPRVWGTLLTPISNGFVYRFIPTGVGNTILTCTALLLSAVHPHGCGEHTMVINGIFKKIGSSPRVWGTR